MVICPTGADIKDQSGETGGLRQNCDDRSRLEVRVGEMISVYHIFREKTTMKMKHDKSTKTGRRP